MRAHGPITFAQHDFLVLVYGPTVVIREEWWTVSHSVPALLKSAKA